MADAIFDGHRLAREIDSDNPRWALPYVPEERILRMTDAGYDAIIDAHRDDAARTTLLKNDRFAY
ncbi:hypothetical protein LWC35_19660 [Pseudonocardia kujensis]|uniref:hypothetical protein n=1 Tax=Pseudonocardia kujensis TaxID=1128675 RepID=UPI001E600437|nr:hypothetical protein [Pseudonocardia kujensis]MCE0765098.1 hypothetical protein [Pseudonocardia kujensis]